MQITTTIQFSRISSALSFPWPLVSIPRIKSIRCRVRAMAGPLHSTNNQHRLITHGLTELWWLHDHLASEERRKRVGAVIAAFLRGEPEGSEFEFHTSVSENSFDDQIDMVMKPMQKRTISFRGGFNHRKEFNLVTMRSCAHLKAGLQTKWILRFLLGCGWRVTHSLFNLVKRFNECRRRFLERFYALMANVISGDSIRFYLIWEKGFFHRFKYSYMFVYFEIFHKDFISYYCIK